MGKGCRGEGSSTNDLLLCIFMRTESHFLHCIRHPYLGEEEHNNGSLSGFPISGSFSTIVQRAFGWNFLSLERSAHAKA